MKVIQQEEVSFCTILIRKEKARLPGLCLLIETDLSIPPTSDTLIVSIRWTKCRANFGG